MEKEGVGEGVEGKGKMLEVFIESESFTREGAKGIATKQSVEE